MDGTVFVGLANARMTEVDFDLGHGVIASPTYAHLMAPFMVAFTPAEPGKAHPPPWAAAEGGLGFDIFIQISVPDAVEETVGLDPQWAAWVLAAMLRLRAGPHIGVPVLSNHAFLKASSARDVARFTPIEVSPRMLVVEQPDPNILTDLDFAWVKAHWTTGAALIGRDASFSLLLEAVDQCASARHEGLALLWLWGGLEAIFSPAKAELRYRISSAIAAFLEPPGLGRMGLQKQVAKLYDSRSSAAHGRKDKATGALADTYRLAARLVTKIVEEAHVPTHAELEARLFGAHDA